MEIFEIREKIASGEDSYTQFKENIFDANKLAEEFVAFSNADGGVILIGVRDDGKICGVSDFDISRLNQLISNTANENVKPPIYPLTQIDEIDGNKILVVNVKRGDAKPYQTSKGIYFTKSGSDKRRISTEELRRLFAESQKLYADEERLAGSDISDLNIELFYRFLKRDNIAVYEELKAGKLELETTLKNLGLFKDGSLTLAGNLIFGLDPQRFSPSFYVDCVYFDGNDISVGKFVSKKTLKGTLARIYEDAIGFLTSHLLSRQTEENFNSQGELEINEAALGELVVNALIHRDYFICSSVKIFIFHNRVEIISPGKLVNSLTVEKIKNGISIHRNPILNSICKNVLPYSGYGSGVKRALSLQPNIKFINDIDKEEFRCVIMR